MGSSTISLVLSTIINSDYHPQFISPLLTPGPLLFWIYEFLRAPNIPLETVLNMMFSEIDIIEERHRRFGLCG